MSNKIIFPNEYTTFRHCYFENRKVKLSLIKTIFQAFIEYHENIDDIDELVISTGYTDLLLKDDKKMNLIKKMKPNQIVFIHGSRGYPSYIRSSDVKKFSSFATLKQRDILFSVSNSSSLFSCLKFLEKLYYCEHCDALNMYDITWTRHKNSKKFVLRVNINTEAG